jgi:histidinol-phosphatase (PHP family)
VGEDREYVEEAINNNYKVLGFTDHTPWPYTNFTSPIRMFDTQLEEYAQAILALKHAYTEKIHVHLGLECEYFPKYTSWILEEKERLGIEYLILGVHYPPYEEGFKQFAAATSCDEIARYTETVIAGMESGLFTYLCHPDLPLKTYPVFDKHIRTMSEQICKTAVKLTIPLEYNTAGVRLRGVVPEGFGYTSDEFWQIAAEYKCPTVIASDAHDPAVLKDTKSLKEAENKLKAMGIPVLDTLANLE